MNYTNELVTTFKERLNDICDATERLDIEIAHDLHISKQTLSAWRLGTRSPRQPMIIAIAEYFGITVEWLMGYDCPIREEAKLPPASTFSKKEIEIINKYRFIDDRGKENVEDTLNREYERAIEQGKKESAIS